LVARKSRLKMSTIARLDSAPGRGSMRYITWRDFVANRIDHCLISLPAMRTIHRSVDTPYVSEKRLLVLLPRGENHDARASSQTCARQSGMDFTTDLLDLKIVILDEYK